MKVQEDQERLKLNETYRLLVCVDISVMVKTWYLKKNTEAVLYASKDVNLSLRTVSCSCASSEK